MQNIEYIKEISHNIRLRILELTYSAGRSGAHAGGGLSAVEIMATLYGAVLKYNINNPLDKNRDRFILSKGHSAIALFSTLEQVGFLTKEELIEENSERIHAHAADMAQDAIKAIQAHFKNAFK